VALLLREAGLSEPGMAHSLLAPLAADLVKHRLDERATTAVLKRELGRLARTVAASGPDLDGLA
jgi:hypothetical protein